MSRVDDPRPSEEQVQGMDLRERALDRIKHAAGPSDESDEVVEAKRKLEEMGFEFYPIQPITLTQLLEENPDSFTNSYHEPVFHQYLNTYKPPEEFMLAVREISENNVIEGSRGKSFAEQLAMVDELSRTTIEPYVPKAHAIMLPATVLAQVDFGYTEGYGDHSEWENPYAGPQDFQGARFLVNTFTYTLDREDRSNQVTLGRAGHNDPLRVKVLGADGKPNLAAVYGVVIDKRKPTGRPLPTR